jgi:uncharacterized membrane protein
MESHSAPIANIGTGERRKRLVWGIVAFVVGVVIAVLLAAIHAPPFWRLPLFLLFSFAALGFFQARDKTCVKLAARGQRDMDTGPQPIPDAGELRLVERQARAVYVKSAITAAILTVLALIP